MVNENPTNRLAMELIREIGRLNPAGGEGGKASGRYVTPFISELARLRPRIVLAGISQILPHLNSEPYSLRSAIVTAIGHILVYIGGIGEHSRG
jgi:condensin complex subunit 1